MEGKRHMLEGFQAGCAHHGEPGMRSGQDANSGPWQLQLRMCQASGNPPHPSSSVTSKPTMNDVAQALLPLLHERPSTAAPVQGGQQVEPRNSICQRKLREQVGLLNEYIKSNWIQALVQLKGEISNLHKDFLDFFSGRITEITTDQQREELRMRMADAREVLFRDMMQRIWASCFDFGDWRRRQLKTRLEAETNRPNDDGSSEGLVSLLESQVSESEVNLHFRVLVCALAVWEESAEELGLEQELLPD